MKIMLYLIFKWYAVAMEMSRHFGILRLWNRQVAFESWNTVAAHDGSVSFAATELSIADILIHPQDGDRKPDITGVG